MALLSLNEIFDIIIMTAAVGFIFSDVFQRYSVKRDYEPLVDYRHGFDWHAFLFAVYVTAPAIILHEFGHKFVALSYGVDATFNAAYVWLAAGILLKLFSGIIFFIPAYVTHAPVGILQDTLIALSGPLVNLALWLLALLILKNNWLEKKYHNGLELSAKINMFLFLFNMIPIPGFDGFSVFSGLLKLLFG